MAGCVNITPKVTSVYRWKGETVKDEESLMMIKTKTSMVSQLIEFVRKNHPYDVCEVISVPVSLNVFGECELMFHFNTKCKYGIKF
jgi:protein cutA homolog